MYYPMRSIETPTIGKKRYFGYEFDEQDGHEVTYLDKPNELLIGKPHLIAEWYSCSLITAVVATKGNSLI